MRKAAQTGEEIVPLAPHARRLRELFGDIQEFGDEAVRSDRVIQCDEIPDVFKVLDGLIARR